MIDPQTKLDPAVTTILHALRELECDNDETTNSMESNIIYITLQLLNEIYTTKADEYLVIGLLESLKLSYFDVKIHPNT